MEDQVPIPVLKAQLFFPRKLRRRTNYFWAFKQPVNREIEMKVRKMKRNIIYRADKCATGVYEHYVDFVAKKDKLPELKSLERISEQIQAGILTPTKLRNAIYNRILEEAADVQIVAAQEEAAARQFIGETVAAAELAKQAAIATVTAKDAIEAAQFAKEAAEAARVAEVAAESAKIAKRTKETFENAKLARKANAVAAFAKKTAADAQLVEDGKTTLEATPVEAVLEGRLGKLLLSEDCGGDQCKRDDCNCRGNSQRATTQGVVKTLKF